MPASLPMDKLVIDNQQLVDQERQHIQLFNGGVGSVYVKTQTENGGVFDRFRSRIP